MNKNIKQVQLIKDERKIKETQKLHGLSDLDYEQFMEKIGHVYSVKNGTNVTVQYNIDKGICHKIFHYSLLVDRTDFYSCNSINISNEFSNVPSKKIKSNLSPNTSGRDQTSLRTIYHLTTDSKLEDLFKAIQDDNITDISSICKANININDYDSKRQNALHCASHNGNVKKMKTLIHNKINVLATDIDGDNALHLAIFGSKIHSIIYLSENYPVLLEKENDKKETPFLLAAKKNITDFLLIFIKFNSEIINRQDIRGNTVMHYIAKNNNHDFLKKILSYEYVKWDFFNTDGFTPFHIACYFGSKEIIEELCKYCKTSNQMTLLTQLRPNQESGVHLLIRNKYYDLAHYLIEYLKWTWHKDPQCMKYGTILHCAVNETHLNLVKTIVTLDPKVMNLTNSDGKTSLDVALEIYKKGGQNNYIQGRDIATYLHLNKAQIKIPQHKDYLKSVMKNIS